MASSAPGSPVKFPGLPSAPLPPSSLGVASTLAPCLPPDLSTVIASLSPTQSPVARSKDGLIRMLLQSGEAVAASDPLTARLISLIQLDHSYSKPWNWRPESSLCQPTRTLFVPRVNRPGPGVVETDHDSCDEDGGLLDVVSEPVKRSPVYDGEKARRLMAECDRFTCFTRPSLASLNSEEEESEDEEMVGWEERIARDNWSAAQSKLFGKVMKVLGQDRLSRLATDGADQEPILRRLSVDKSAKRMRAVLAAPPCVWDRSLVQWLHNTLSTFLPRPLLSAWLDILQSLKAKIPGLMERILAGAGGHHIDPKARTVAQEGLLLLLRRPWDPVERGLASRRMARLPNNPIIIVAPPAPGPDQRENKSISARMKFWNNQLGSLGKVIVINMQPPRGEQAQRTGVSFYLHQMVSATLNKVREIRNGSGDRPVIVMGWGPGAAIAAHVAHIERLAGLVCLGFPVSTLAGVRGQVGDTLLDLKTPGLFVVGERSSQCNTDDIEDIREKMTVETGLIIVGGADDQLRLTNKKKRAELVTQTMVDKNIIEQIRAFLLGILLKQSQAAMERDSRSESTFAVPGQEGAAKKMKARKRLGELGSASPGKKFRASAPGSLPAAPLSPGGAPLLMINNKAAAKKTRRPKKLKMPETETGFTLSSGSITPLPASLLSISTPLPPVSGAGKDAGDPPPLPIRIPGLPVCSAVSPTPRVIQYAAAKSEAPKVTNNPTTPTWSVAMSRPVTAARPAVGQLLLSSFHRNLSPTKLVTGGQAVPVSPRGPGTVQIQLPSPGVMRGQPGQISPEKLLILMSPSKEGQPQPPRISPGSGKIVMAATSPGRSAEAAAVSRVLLQSGQSGLKPEASARGGLVLTPAPSLSPTKPASGTATPASTASPSGSASVSPKKN